MGTEVGRWGEGNLESQGRGPLHVAIQVGRGEDGEGGQDGTGMGPLQKLAGAKGLGRSKPMKERRAK